MGTTDVGNYALAKGLLPAQQFCAVKIFLEPAIPFLSPLHLREHIIALLIILDWY